jgi:quinol monooxygenase YgiN
MSIRIVLTRIAKPGMASALAAAYKERCRAVRQEPGCEQFEVFQGVENPDRFVTMERWKDAAAEEAHKNLTQASKPVVRELSVGAGEREDYTYNRTR